MKYELKHVEGNQHILIVDGFEIASVYTYKDNYTVEIKKLIDDAEIGNATEKAFDKDGEFEINLGTHNTFYNVTELVSYFKED